ncbi:hypothetical protein ACWD3J_16770 [Streptomyces sp. NPDC002755]
MTLATSLLETAVLTRDAGHPSPLIPEERLQSHSVMAAVDGQRKHLPPACKLRIH